MRMLVLCMSNAGWSPTVAEFGFVPFVEIAEHVISAGVQFCPQTSAGDPVRAVVRGDGSQRGQLRSQTEP